MTTIFRQGGRRRAVFTRGLQIFVTPWVYYYFVSELVQACWAGHHPLLWKSCMHRPADQKLSLSWDSIPIRKKPHISIICCLARYSMRTKGPEEGGGISFKGQLKLPFNLKPADFYASWINIGTNLLMALKYFHLIQKYTLLSVFSVTRRSSDSDWLTER